MAVMAVLCGFTRVHSVRTDDTCDSVPGSRLSLLRPLSASRLFGGYLEFRSLGDCAVRNAFRSLVHGANAVSPGGTANRDYDTRGDHVRAGIACPDLHSRADVCSNFFDSRQHLRVRYIWSKEQPRASTCPDVAVQCVGAARRKSAQIRKSNRALSRARCSLYAAFRRFRGSPADWLDGDR